MAGEEAQRILAAAVNHFVAAKISRPDADGVAGWFSLSVSLGFPLETLLYRRRRVKPRGKRFEPVTQRRRRQDADH